MPRLIFIYLYIVRKRKNRQPKQEEYQFVWFNPITWVILFFAVLMFAMAGAWEGCTEFKDDMRGMF